MKPTVVLVHGAWADASSWDGEVSALRKQGYDVRAIANPLENLTTDAEYVKSFLSTLSGPIVLAGHSYGGAVITNAAVDNPNIKALVYIDAAAPDVGETNGSLSGADSVLKTNPDGKLFDKVPYPGAPAGAVDLYLKQDIFVHNFGSDLPPDLATQLWATQRAASTSAFDTPSKYAAWKTIPSWYFISSGDQIITPTSEKAMAQRAHSHVTLFDGGSHLTLISHPDAVTAVIQQAIDSVR
ncbi:alpha/beta fold hydrolase [Pseudonocardia xinjiangensis]|uniref:alpha/beta fold hydrolase n=1 Tax=Pseudonocardia xinjiangensis TaxID=75289 RepID=UPI001B7D1EF0|nr:alpha/beta hydrolase [Pseudonocardia xinjiangensis]